MSQDNFIGEWFLPDTSVCQPVIDFFEANPNKYEGGFSQGTEGKFAVDKEIKKSVDLRISHEDLAQESIFNYFVQLGLTVDKYSEKYPWCNAYSAWRITECAQIQKYDPKGGYFKYHSERITAAPVLSARHLVFMTYLNTVSEGGETEFLHQEIKVKPEMGKTLIWPADWTHTHRGLPAPSEEKYIITGWYSYC